MLTITCSIKLSELEDTITDWLSDGYSREEAVESIFCEEIDNCLADADRGYYDYIIRQVGSQTEPIGNFHPGRKVFPPNLTLITVVFNIEGIERGTSKDKLPDIVAEVFDDFPGAVEPGNSLKLQQAA